MKFKFLPAMMLAVALPFAAHAVVPVSTSELYQVSDAFLRETPAKVSAGYLIVKNTTDKDDTLISAEATETNHKKWADRIELHEVKADAKGVMQMNKVSEIKFPAKGTMELRPGGYHLMVFGVNGKLVAGEKKSMQLHFKNGGVLPVEFTVQKMSYGGMKSEDHNSMHHMAH